MVTLARSGPPTAGAMGPGQSQRRPSLSICLCAALFAAAVALAAPARGDAEPWANGVVSVGGAITEIVYALDAEDRVIAVDSTSRYPPQAQEHPDVGYMRQLSAEAILALEPGLVLAEADAGPPAALDQLRAAGVPLVVVPDHPSPDGVLEKVAAVAQALGLESRGNELSALLEQEFEDLLQRLSAVDHRPSVLFLLSIGRGAPLAAGRGTSADGIIALAGGRNAVAELDGYKPLSPEAAAGAAPEVVLVTERTLRLLGGAAALLERPEIAVTPAGRSSRLLVMDGLLLLGFGPRTPEAIRHLAAALHPGLDLAHATD